MEDDVYRLKEFCGKLKSFSGYKNADKCVEICNKRIIYVQAKKEFNTSDLHSIKSAMEKFTSISDYKDSKERIVQCDNKIISLQNSIYRSALVDEQQGNVPSLRKAIEKYKSIKNWGDSARRIDACYALIDILNRKAQELCQHCGGTFKGLFNKVCTQCGKPKDY